MAGNSSALYELKYRIRMMSTRPYDKLADVLVIGCGAAGCSCALEAARRGLQVIMITNSAEPSESNSDHAQGGIVACPSDDTPESLVADVLAVGDGLCNEPAVRLLAESVPEVVDKFLIGALGVQFSRTHSGELDFTQEAAHSRRRIAHADDATGHAISQKLLAAVSKESRIELLTRHSAVDLITIPHHSTDPATVYQGIECFGAYVLDQRNGVVQRFLAPRTMLATGGLGQLYLHTTNPRVARGDGLAMAHRAGAEIINAEYVQFHPTAFYHRDADRFLISESVRGEGAILRTRDGRDFMRDYHPHGSLAPRDVVARAIHEEMLKRGEEYVVLDMGSLAVDPRRRFPTIYETCLRYGVDISTEAIPVVPAAHYFCGGVKVDLWGLTNIKRLYGLGEVSCTGVHGANRLASTSLLEAILWGLRAAEDAARDLSPLPAEQPGRIDFWHDEGLTEVIDPLLMIQDWMMIKSTMWNYAGIVRTSKRLDRAVADLSYLAHRIEQFYQESKLSDALIGLRNGLEAAQIIAEAASRNPTSRGCHYRTD
jgi:L-aspartate oxidase